MRCAQFSELEKEFCIRRRFLIPSHVADTYLQPGQKHILFDDNLHLNDDLNLDWGAFETLGGANPHEVKGVIIMGDLVIEGDLLNTDIDSGPLLLVRGNLVANNLRSGGGTIIVGHDASIRDIVFGNYNHGELIIQNDLYVGLLIMRDHGFSANRIHSSHTVSDDTDLDPDSGDEADKLSRINAHLEVNIDDVDMLGTYLKEGTPALKASSRNTHMSKPTVFPATPQEVIQYVQTQKRVFGGDISLQLHQDQDFMLRLCSIHLDVFNGLKNRWHLSADFMQAALDSGSRQVANYIKFVEDQSIRQQLLNQIAEVQ
jgi:hypothetical protein